MERYRIHHIGYLTSDINNTAKAFELLGCQAGASITDDTTDPYMLYAQGKRNNYRNSTSV